MPKKYYPLLGSKRGEIVALSHLSPEVKNNICPVIQVVDDSLLTIPKSSKTGKAIYKDELEKFLKKDWSFVGNQVILDFSPVTDIDSKQTLIKKMLTTLLKTGVNIIPALNIGMASSSAAMLRDFATENRLQICLKHADINGGYQNLSDAISRLVKYSKAPTNRLLVLYDIGNTSEDIHVTVRDNALTAIKLLPQKIDDWHAFILASSSFPDNLSNFLVKAEAQLLPRFEWQVWNHIKNQTGLETIFYGDFGIKSSDVGEAGFAGSVSIKYTTETHYLIFRGKLTAEHKDGHGQYITHAKKLVKHKGYSGKDFSWGDQRIYEIAQQEVNGEKRKTGSSTTWVQISQNHHITLLESLL